jgi:hypothetical protein
MAARTFPEGFPLGGNQLQRFISHLPVMIRTRHAYPWRIGGIEVASVIKVIWVLIFSGTSDEWGERSGRAPGQGAKWKKRGFEDGKQNEIDSQQDHNIL